MAKNTRSKLTAISPKKPDSQLLKLELIKHLQFDQEVEFPGEVTLYWGRTLAGFGEEPKNQMQYRGGIKLKKKHSTLFPDDIRMCVYEITGTPFTFPDPNYSIELPSHEPFKEIRGKPNQLETTVELGRPIGELARSEATLIVEAYESW